MAAPSRRELVVLGLAAGVAAGGCAWAQPMKGEAMDIDEGMFVDIDGLEQWIAIRGRDRRNPVMLLLHGGPGAPTSGMAHLFAAWEKDFTLVHWDQPGGGATYAKAGGLNLGPLTVDRCAADGIAVTQFVCRRLKTRKVVLLGTSWGTCLGVAMIQRRPELFAAYVGASQAVGGDGRRLGYDMALKAARERGDSAAVAALERVGPPPYKTFEDFLVRQTYTNPPGLPPTPREAAANARLAQGTAGPPPADAKYVPHGLPPQDFIKVFMETQMKTFGNLDAWNARDLGTAFKVPVFIFQGDHDLNTPLATARAWFDQISAPKKGFHVLEGSGHNTLAFADEILPILHSEVRPMALRSAVPQIA